MNEPKEEKYFVLKRLGFIFLIELVLFTLFTIVTQSLVEFLEQINENISRADESVQIICGIVIGAVAMIGSFSCVKAFFDKKIKQGMKGKIAIGMLAISLLLSGILYSSFHSTIKTREEIAATLYETEDIKIKQLIWSDEEIETFVNKVVEEIIQIHQSYFLRMSIGCMIGSIFGAGIGVLILRKKEVTLEEMESKDAF